MTPTHRSTTAEATEELGEAIASDLAPGDLLLLEGDLAAGKTTMVRGIVRGLAGSPEDVSSPTFVLVQSYPCRQPGITVLHHVDLYRLADSPAQLRGIGLEEMLSEADAVTAVEWPKDSLLDWLPSDARLWHIRLEINPDDSRTISINSEF
jgi:tRNA threonylcarbamoyl adenosine modification protein YjeE